MKTKYYGWYRQDGNSDSNPKLQRAGFWAARTFECLLRVSADFNLDGKVPGHYADPTYLAKRMMVTDILPLEEAETVVAKALSRLSDPDPRWTLVEVEEDGTVMILGWRGGEEPQSSTERSRNHRRVKALEARLAEMQALLEKQGGPEPDQPPPTARAGGDSATATPRNASATISNGAATPCNVRNDATVDKMREDQIRSDPPPTPSAGAAGDASRKPKRRRKGEPSELGAKVLARINELAGTAYRSSPHLEARIAEGVPEADLLAVVESRARDPWWLGTVQLKPSALFRPEKFSEHLGAARAGPPRLRPVRQGPVPLPEFPDRPEFQQGDEVTELCIHCDAPVVQRLEGEGWVYLPHECGAEPVRAHA